MVIFRQKVIIVIEINIKLFSILIYQLLMIIIISSNTHITEDEDNT